MTTRALPPPSNSLSLARLIRGPTLFGVVTIAALVAGVGAWGGSAPLSSAAVASGQVVVQSNRKTVQHFEGGIVRALYVQDGDTVRTGDVLVRLDDTKARTNLESLEGRFYGNLARAARLIAERDEKAEIAFPEELSAATSGAAKEAITGQHRIFEARRIWLDGQIAILHQQIAQAQEEITALDAQVHSETRQMELIDEELKGVQELVNKGLERRPRLLSLQRNSEEISGRRSDHLGQIARAQQRIGEARLRMADLQNTRTNDITKELRETQDDLYDLREKLVAARDVLDRVDIRAPRDGIVVNSRFHTVGGVIGPGEPILEIVPQREELVVEARVRMDDIDTVHAGLPAEVRLTAYKQRWTPAVDGVVQTVSADRLQDNRTGDAFFIARIAVDPASLAKQPNIKLLPGMPADVLILNHPRTALDYMLSPIISSLHRSFREE